MKFLFVSKNGSQLSLAQRVASEGHYTSIISTNNIGAGIVRQIPYTTELSSLVLKESPDVVLFDNPSDGHHADILRSRGIRSLFSSRWSNTLDTNSIYTDKVLRSIGFTPYDGSQAGYPLIAEGWFNGNKFITTLLSYSYNYLFNDNIGPRVDCMGSVVWGRFNRGRLFKETIKRMEIPLRKVEYRGPISLDLIVNDKDFCADNLKACPRIPTLSSFLEGAKISVSDFLLSLSSGDNTPPIYIDEWVVMVSLSIPPWPYAITSNSNVCIGGINTDNLRHIWMEDVKKDDSSYICSNTTGRIGNVTARGKTIREARRRVYRTIERLNVPSLQYRTDIGRDFPDMFSDLRKWGWL